jgi:DNA-binding transcriptional LysR family regulator
MDRLEAMRTLVVMVECGSLTAASRNLGVSLTTVSKRISNLERHLGTQLLMRDAHRLYPTEAGEVFANSCRRILDELDDAERGISGRTL